MPYDIRTYKCPTCKGKFSQIHVWVDHHGAHHKLDGKRCPPEGVAMLSTVVEKEEDELSDEERQVIAMNYVDYR
jgi:hypothetical protein